MYNINKIISSFFMLIIHIYYFQFNKIFTQVAFIIDLNDLYEIYLFHIIIYSLHYHLFIFIHSLHQVFIIVVKYHILQTDHDSEYHNRNFFFKSLD